MRLFAKKEKEIHYDIKTIDKTDATYRIIIGQRSNGKTYAVIRKCLEEFFKTGKPSAYLRRYAEDLKSNNIKQLLTPHEAYIKKQTKGEYDAIEYRTNEFKLVKMKDGKVIKRSPVVLYTTALSNWERSKGADRGEVAYIVFDEFMTRAPYLKDEFMTFANVLSSFIRDRKGVIIYMIANTVNKYAPYIDEMGLYQVKDQEQGTIQVYTYNNDALTVAVEYCLEAEATKDVQYYYAFNNSQLDMIRTGMWEEDTYPHLGDFSIHPEDIKLKFLVHFNLQDVVGEVIQRDDALFVYFHPLGNSNYKWSSKDIVYTDQPTIFETWEHSFMCVPSSNERITKARTIIYRLIAQNKCFFSSNSVGEIVRNFVVNTRNIINQFG